MRFIFQYADSFADMHIKRKLKKQNVLTSFQKSSILENDSFQNTACMFCKSAGII